MRLTQWNSYNGAYETQIHSNSGFKYRINGIERERNGTIQTIIPSYFISGDIVDRLAEYENTELTPQEIHEMKEAIEKLKESNDILRKNNDEYFKEYEKLLLENQRLRELVRVYLK